MAAPRTPPRLLAGAVQLALAGRRPRPIEWRLRPAGPRVGWSSRAAGALAAPSRDLVICGGCPGHCPPCASRPRTLAPPPGHSPAERLAQPAARTHQAAARDRPNSAHLGALDDTKAGSPALDRRHAADSPGRPGLLDLAHPTGPRAPLAGSPVLGTGLDREGCRGGGGGPLDPLGPRAAGQRASRQSCARATRPADPPPAQVATCSAVPGCGPPRPPPQTGSTQVDRHGATYGIRNRRRGRPRCETLITYYDFGEHLGREATVAPSSPSRLLRTPTATADRAGPGRRGPRPRRPVVSGVPAVIARGQPRSPPAAPWAPGSGFRLGGVDHPGRFLVTSAPVSRGQQGRASLPTARAALRGRRPRGRPTGGDPASGSDLEPVSL